MDTLTWGGYFFPSTSTLGSQVHRWSSGMLAKTDGRWPPQPLQAFLAVYCVKPFSDFILLWYVIIIRERERLTASRASSREAHDDYWLVGDGQPNLGLVVVVDAVWRGKPRLPYRLRRFGGEVIRWCEDAVEKLFEDGLVLFCLPWGVDDGPIYI